MKSTIVMCVLVLSVAGAIAVGNFLPGGLSDAMTKAAGAAQQAMGGGANPLQQVMGGGNPFAKALEDMQKMAGDGDAVKQMQDMLQKGMQEATDGEMKKQFQEALAKVQNMEGLPKEDIMKALGQLQQG